MPITTFNFLTCNLHGPKEKYSGFRELGAQGAVLEKAEVKDDPRANTTYSIS
jgi:hypothetical protein